MFVLAITALIALVLAGSLVFIVILIGLRHAHPADLALQRPTAAAALASRVVGLHVRRAGVTPTDTPITWAQVTR